VTTTRAIVDLSQELLARSTNGLSDVGSVAAGDEMCPAIIELEDRVTSFRLAVAETDPYRRIVILLESAGQLLEVPFDRFVVPSGDV
jgi:hypothetical protein